MRVGVRVRVRVGIRNRVLYEGCRCLFNHQMKLSVLYYRVCTLTALVPTTGCDLMLLKLDISSITLTLGFPMVEVR